MLDPQIILGELVTLKLLALFLTSYLPEWFFVIIRVVIHRIWYQS